MIQRHKEDVDLINVTTMLILMKGMMMVIMMVAMTGGMMGDHVLWANAQSDDSMFPTCAPSS